MKTLDNVLHELYKHKKKKIVVLGDFNINILKNNKITSTLQDLCKKYNMTIHINEPTRRLSCIDQILSNIEDASASVLHLGLSDHETAQMLNFPAVNKKSEPKVSFIFKRDYNKDNIRLYQNSISQLSFSEVYSENDIDSAFEKFQDLLCSIVL